MPPSRYAQYASTLHESLEKLHEKRLVSATLRSIDTLARCELFLQLPLHQVGLDIATMQVRRDVMAELMERNIRRVVDMGVTREEVEAVRARAVARLGSEAERMAFFESDGLLGFGFLQAKRLNVHELLLDPEASVHEDDENDGHLLVEAASLSPLPSLVGPLKWDLVHLPPPSSGPCAQGEDDNQWPFPMRPKRHVYGLTPRHFRVRAIVGSVAYVARLMETNVCWCGLIVKLLLRWLREDLAAYAPSRFTLSIEYYVDCGLFELFSRRLPVDAKTGRADDPAQWALTIAFLGRALSLMMEMQPEESRAATRASWRALEVKTVQLFAVGAETTLLQQAENLFILLRFMIRLVNQFHVYALNVQLTLLRRPVEANGIVFELRHLRPSLGDAIVLFSRHRTTPPMDVILEHILHGVVTPCPCALLFHRQIETLHMDAARLDALQGEFTRLVRLSICTAVLVGHGVTAPAYWDRVVQALGPLQMERWRPLVLFSGSGKELVGLIAHDGLAAELAGGATEARSLTRAMELALGSLEDPVFRTTHLRLVGALRQRLGSSDALPPPFLTALPPLVAALHRIAHQLRRIVYINGSVYGQLYAKMQAEADEADEGPEEGLLIDSLTAQNAELLVEVKALSDDLDELSMKHESAQRVVRRTLKALSKLVVGLKALAELADAERARIVGPPRDRRAPSSPKMAKRARR